MPSPKQESARCYNTVRRHRREDAISSIIIDGYNLIGIQHRDLAKKRQELIGLLVEYRRLRGHHIVVVFDGWKTGGREEQHLATGGVRIVYSRLGDRADRVITDLVSSRQQEWVVVTSDRDVAAHVWASGSVAVPSERFMEILEHAAGKDQDDSGDFGDRESGSASGRSKRQRALARVLRKL